MSSPQVHTVTRQANEIGRDHKVSCKYAWDRVRRVFVWKFFRNNVFIGKTAKLDQVVPKMILFTTSTVTPTIGEQA